MKQRIARSYRLAAGVAGLLVGLMCLAVAVWLVGLDQLRDMSDKQARTSSTLRAIDFDTRNTLLRLTRNYPPDCSEENLRRLRTEVFLSTYQVDVGVLDAQHRLLCTTVLGALVHPVPTPAPDVSTVSEQGLELRVNFQIPLLVGEGRYPATVTASGRFNTVINPQAAEDVFCADDGVLRMLLPQGRMHVVHADATLAPALAQRLADPHLLTVDVHGYSWRDGAFISSLRVAGTHYVKQYVTPWPQFLYEHREPLLLSLLGAWVLGGLCYGALAPVFRSWQGLEVRIGRLLTERNIRCMYQPIVDLQTGRTVGLEVLMRLQDGAVLLNPADVLPAVVQRDLCWRLDQLVVQTALRELAPRLKSWPGFNVCFNIFPRNVRCELLHEFIAAEVLRSQAQGLSIEIEVIEQGEHDALFDEIAGLKQHGYLISVDDFGTGYSNLNSLRALAPDKLKIDKSFVYEMEDASVRSTLIPQIIDIARAVGARVVAEGIENEAQREKLLALGVEYGQGYLFARPLSADALDDHLRAQADALQGQS